MKSYFKTLLPKRVSKTLIVILFMAGVVGWFVPALFSHFNMLYPPKIELPLGDPKGVAIDNFGNIYCGSRYYERIQAYDPEGKFIRGFSTGFRRGRGSLFSFFINDSNELHIRVFDALLTDMGMVDRLIIYDLEGNLINAEEFPSKDVPYFYKTKNRVRDSSGNLYILKGFLFPRVIKQATNDKESIIISTPIWLWPFQGPLPNFAFFFLGLFGLIFLHIKSDLKSDYKPVKMPKSILGRFPKRKKLLMIFLLVVAFVGTAITLAILTPLAFERYPALIGYGAITFGIAFVLAVIIMLFSGFRMKLHLRKRHINVWKMSKDDSFKKSAEFGRQIKTLNDPVLRKISATGDKYAKLCLLVWLIIFVLVCAVVVTFDIIGVGK